MGTIIKIKSFDSDEKSVAIVEKVGAVTEMSITFQTAVQLTIMYL